jgi:GNAT superfamily N-acetyltransferase
MKREEVDMTMEWADREGWNPGLHDAEAFYHTDPNGFFAGEIAGEMIASASLVNYPGELSFAGLLIVRKDMRGQGIGSKMIGHILSRGRCRNIGADGVAAMLPTYERKGFRFAYWNHRFQGWGGGEAPKDLMAATELPFDDLVHYDRAIFQAPRNPFLKAFLAQDDQTSLAALKEGEIVGYGCIRRCRTGHKVGPLFAEDRRTAEKVLRGLIATVPGEPFFLDVPQPNAEGMVLVQDLRMTEVFRTGRIYTKIAPAVPLNKVFGVTSFELG